MADRASIFRSIDGGIDAGRFRAGAIRMNIPQVKVDFNNNRFVATCTCGQWRLEVDFDKHESTIKILDKIDAAYLDHLKSCTLTAGKSTPP